MISNLTNEVLAFLTAVIFSSALTPVVIKIYRSRKWLDDPTKSSHAKKTHREATPRGGGLIIYFAVFLCSLLFFSFDSHLVAILLGAAVLTLVGFLDDIYDINPLIRIFTGITAALIVVGSGIGIAYVSNPFSTEVIHLNYPQLSFSFLGEMRSIWILADLFALFFILWNMNIVNWSKGVDGQLPSFVSVALIFVGLLSKQFQDDPTQFDTVTLSFIAAGAFIGLLFYNWYPQKIQPGYGAGSLAGYFLGILAILSGAKVATILMVLAIPTADAVFTILRRIKSGKSPLWGDRGHLHHKLLDVFGWGRRRIALFYASASFGMGVLSLYLNTWGKLITIVVVTGFIFSVLITAKLKQTQQSSKT